MGSGLRFVAAGGRRECLLVVLWKEEGKVQSYIGKFGRSESQMEMG